MNLKTIINYLFIFTLIVIISCKKEILEDKKTEKPITDIIDIKVDTTLLDNLIKKVFPNDPSIIYAPNQKPYILLNHPISIPGVIYNDSIIEKDGGTKKIRFTLENISTLNEKDKLTAKCDSKGDSLYFEGTDLLADGDHQYELNWKLTSFNETNNQWEELSNKNTVIKFKTQLLNYNLIQKTGCENSKPFVIFNFPINKSFKVGEHNLTLRVKNLVINSYGNEIEFTQNWNSDSTRVDFSLTNPVHFGRSINLNFDIKWDIPSSKTSSIFDKSYTYDFFPTVNNDGTEGYIEYSYPISRQYNFLPKEYNKGYLKFIKYPSNFTSQNNNLIAEFCDKEGNTLTSDVTISQDSLFWEYDLPKTLSNEKVYRLTFKQNTGSDNYTDIISYYFRTSYYNTFQDKFFANSLTKYFSDILSTGIHSFSTRLNDNEEDWDIFETRKAWNNFSSYAVGLVRFENILEKQDWYTRNDNGKKMYDFLSEKPELLKGRTIEPIGLPPLRTSFLKSWNGWTYLSDEQCDAFEALTIKPYLVEVTNYIQGIWNSDYMASSLQNHGIESFNLYKGVQTMKVYYEIPGIKKITSEYEFDMVSN